MSLPDPSLLPPPPPPPTSSTSTSTSSPSSPSPSRSPSPLASLSSPSASTRGAASSVSFATGTFHPELTDAVPSTPASKQRWILVSEYSQHFLAHSTVSLATCSWPGVKGIAASSEYVALPWRDTARARQAGAGAMAAAAVSTGGRKARTLGAVGVFALSPDVPSPIADRPPLVRAHVGPVMDLAFSPFHARLLATCGEDGTAKLWRMPESGDITEDMLDPRCTLDATATSAAAAISNNRSSRLCGLTFHTRSESILTTCSAAHQVSVWDLSEGVAHATLPHEDTVYHMSWCPSGQVLATTSKDRWVRLFDVRSDNSPTVSFQAHLGSKCSQVVWLDGNSASSSTYLFTAGFDRRSSLQLAIWDRRKMDKCVGERSTVFQQALGTPTVVYDRSSSLVGIALKGKTGVRFFEVAESRDSLEYLNEYVAPHPIRAMAFGRLPGEEFNCSDPTSLQPASANLPSLFLAANDRISHLRMQHSGVLQAAIIARRTRERTATAEAFNALMGDTDSPRIGLNDSASGWFSGRGAEAIEASEPAQATRRGAVIVEEQLSPAFEDEEPPPPPPPLPLSAEQATAAALDDSLIMEPLDTLENLGTARRMAFECPLEQLLVRIGAVLQDDTQKRNQAEQILWKVGAQFDRNGESTLAAQLHDVVLELSALRGASENKGGKKHKRGASDGTSELDALKMAHQMQLHVLNDKVRELESALKQESKANRTLQGKVSSMQRNIAVLERRNERLRRKHTIAGTRHDDPGAEDAAPLHSRLSTSMTFAQMHSLVYLRHCWGNMG